MSQTPPPPLELPEAEAAPAKPVKSKTRGAIETIRTIGLTVLIFYLLTTFVVRPFMVEQTSMEPTFEPSQYILVDELAPRFGGLTRGDVIIFTPPTAENGGPAAAPYIKRIIGLPGDTIELRAGVVIVNGQALPELYTFGGQPTEPENGQDHWTVGPDRLFVLGDHRSSSIDSRTFGPIARSAVAGRVMARYWPINQLEFVSRPTYASPTP